MKQWNADNKDKLAAYNKKWAESNGAMYLWTKAKNRARLQGLDFELEPSDISIPELCPYLGIPLVLELGKGHTQNSPSLDRVDNSKGYVKGNIQVISRRANTMKSNASKEELLRFAKAVLNVFA